MSPLARIFLVLGGALVAACLVSPWIYWAGMAIAEAGLIPALGNFPFHRYFSRVTQIAVIGGGLYLLWSLKIRRLSEFGLHPNAHRWPDLAAGFAVALVAAALLAVVLVTLGWSKMRDGFSAFVLLRIVGTAVVVSCIEEFLFRGVLLGLAMRAIGTVPAAFSVSVVFAVVHFLRPAKAPTEEVNWLSGFDQVAQIIPNLPTPEVLSWGLLTLFLAGMLLAVVTLRTHSLWLAIGIHAGWILGQQGTNLFTKFRIKPPDSNLPFLGPSLVSGAVPTGLLPLASLAICTIGITLYLVWWRRNRT